MRTITYERALVDTLRKRIEERRHFIQIVVGPRQTGKTTAIHQAVTSSSIPVHFATADSLAGDPRLWLEAEWQIARSLVTDARPSALLVIDEIQKLDTWSQVVKALWDADTASGVDLRVVLSGSSSLLITKGLTESLMGRFEVIHSTHWSLAEMEEAFDFTLEEFLRFGGYPGAALLKDDPRRWRDYLTQAIIEPTIAHDVLQFEAVRKPALLRSLFYLGAQFSGQELSYRKILGQLQDKGNTSTIAHYLTLLDNAGILAGLQKFDSNVLQERRSSPRFMVYDTSLMTASLGENVDALLSDPSSRGRIVESAVGAYLLARQSTGELELHWWREGNHEVDFVVRGASGITAIEVKSGSARRAGGLAEFHRRFPEARLMIVGDTGQPLGDFLRGKIGLFA